MEPMYLQVLQKETGRQIKKLLVENGYTVKDVQNAMGFENPQAVYKWISGRSLPSLDNFVILSRLLHTSIEDILVIDGDIVRLWGFSFKLLVHNQWGIRIYEVDFKPFVPIFDILKKIYLDSDI